VLVLAVIACLWFWPLFTGDQIGQSYGLYRTPPWAGMAPAETLPLRPFFLDAAYAFNPWAEVAREQVRAGKLPLWNPYEYGGMTLIGNLQSALFFPLTWILFVLPTGYAWGVIAVLKVLLAGIGTYALARALGVRTAAATIAGVVYMISGPMMVLLQWTLGTVYAMFPWLLLATTLVHRRRDPASVGWLALACGLTIMAGHPETGLISMSAAAVYLLALIGFDRRRNPRVGVALRVGARWLAGMALGVAVAAVVLVPFIVAFGPSVTRVEHNLRFPAGGLHPSYLLQYLAPGVFGNGEPDLFGFPFGYFGLPALLLALVGLWRHRADASARALATMALVGLLVTYGAPPFLWFVEHVPPWSDSYMRERVYFVAALAAAVGAGAGIDSLLRRPLALRRSAVLVVAVGAITLIGYEVADRTGYLIAPGSIKREGLALAALGLALAAAALAALGRLRAPAALAVSLVAVVVSLADLQNLNVMLPPHLAYPDQPPSVGYMKGRPGVFRTAVVRDAGGTTLVPNTAAEYHMESVEGYDFPLSKRWSDFQTAVLGFISPNAESRIARTPPSPQALTGMRMMNVGYYLAAPGTPAPAGLEQVYEGADGVVFRDPRALPRAYVVPRTRRLPEAAALALLVRNGLDPRREAIVEPGAPATPSGGSGRFAAARTERVSADHLRVHLPPGAAGWLVVANAYSPAWRARVDGHDADLHPTNQAATGLPVAAGDRVVDLTLDRRPFWGGFAISLAAFACSAVMILRGRRRRRPALTP
jgi:hypothetical protein